MIMMVVVMILSEDFVVLFAKGIYCGLMNMPESNILCACVSK